MSTDSQVRDVFCDHSVDWHPPQGYGRWAGRTPLVGALVAVVIRRQTQNSEEQQRDIVPSDERKQGSYTTRPRLRWNGA